MEAVANGLAPIDVFIVVLYMVGVFALGSFFGKYVKSAGDFFLASRSLPFWAIGMSIVVSDIGAMSFVGVSGSAYMHGLAVANFDWIGSMPAMVFAAFLFVPYFWRAGAYTIELTRRSGGTFRDYYAVAADPVEGDQRRADERALANLLPEVELRYIDEPESLLTDDAAADRAELWRPLAMLAMVIVLLETFLAWRFGHYAGSLAA